VDRAVSTLERKNQWHQSFQSDDHPPRSSTYGCTLELGVERIKVTDETIDQQINTLLSEVVPERKGSTRGAVTEGIRVTALRGVVPPESVGNGVGTFKVFREGTGADLIIVVRVTPSTESRSGRRIEEI